MSDMRLIVAGAGGRMGRVLVKTISQTKGAVLTGALEAPGSPLLGRGCRRAGRASRQRRRNCPADLWELSKDADGVVDFTVPAATIANVAIAAQRGLVHVIGTTGLSDSDDAVIKSVTSRAIVVQSGNMSLGVNLLAALVRRVAQVARRGFRHRGAGDAPQDEDRRAIRHRAVAGRGGGPGARHRSRQRSVRVRDGHTGERQAGDIGFATLRGGTVVGDHTVIFAGADERIELSHKAGDRALFATGAMKAALWARNQKPGFYTMADVLGLEDF